MQTQKFVIEIQLPYICSEEWVKKEIVRAVNEHANEKVKVAGIWNLKGYC